MYVLKSMYILHLNEHIRNSRNLSRLFVNNFLRRNIDTHCCILYQLIHFQGNRIVY